METLHVIASRTSYRKAFKKTPVPKEDLIKILKAGLAAPSGCNAQTVSLIAVDDPEILTQLKQIAPPLARQDAPAIICILSQKIPTYKDRFFHIQDYSAAIENILLAAVDLGYESCWYEGMVRDDDEVGRKMANILGVPEEFELISYSPIGVAAHPTTFPEKKPFEMRAWLNGFGQQWECEVNE